MFTMSIRGNEDRLDPDAESFPQASHLPIYNCGPDKRRLSSLLGRWRWQRIFHRPESSIGLPMLRRILLVAIIAIAALAWLARVRTAYFSPASASAQTFDVEAPVLESSSLQSSATKAWSKPEAIKIIGFMYFGRRKTVEVLECYLRRNLVSNGGFLDEMLFIVNTDDRGDLNYLSEIIDEVDGYRKVVRVDVKERTTAYEEMLRLSIARDALMIKIDDDLVWMDPNAIPELVATLIDHPEAFSVLANLINSAALGWMHYHRGAIHAYLPEREAPVRPKGDSCGPSAWKASALPTWQPSVDDRSKKPSTEGESEEVVNASTVSKAGAPYPNHRWLPMWSHDTNIYETPMADTQYDPFSNDWKEWSVAAQQHYSLLENLESDQLDRYTMGGDGIWNLRRMRGNVNLLAFWANDVMDNLPFDGSGDDEHQLTITLPQKTHKECLVQTRALASHFSFYCQAGLFDTDLLSRYRAYANEMVCFTDNQISPHANAIF